MAIAKCVSSGLATALETHRAEHHKNILSKLRMQHYGLHKNIYPLYFVHTCA
jgi:hypothetical protein